MKIITLCSLLFSLLHSVLFWGNKLGISVMLFTVTAIFTLITILYKSKKVKNTKSLLLSIPIILLSSTYFLFNNTFFNIANILVILILLAIMLALSLLGDITPCRVLSKIFLIFVGPIDYLKSAKKVIFSYECR